MCIPDPVELMDARMDEQMGLIDEHGCYPCVNCGRKEPAEEMHTVSADPSAPLICNQCAAEQFGWHEA